MKTMEVSVPELGFVAVTRGMAGAGLGLLLAGALSPAARKAVGLTLLAIGALTTIPIASRVLSRQARPEGAALH